MNSHNRLCSGKFYFARHAIYVICDLFTLCKKIPVQDIIYALRYILLRFVYVSINMVSVACDHVLSHRGEFVVDAVIFMIHVVSITCRDDTK